MAEILKERSGLDPQFQWDLTPMFESDAAWETALENLDAEIDSVAAFAGKLSDAITIGCTVTVKGTDGKEASYKIVGSQESDPMHGIISEESPFGKAFLGAKEGQDVVVEAPFGNIHYTVVKIEH